MSHWAFPSAQNPLWRSVIVCTVQKTRSVVKNNQMEIMRPNLVRDSISNVIKGIEMKCHVQSAPFSIPQMELVIIRKAAKNRENCVLQWKDVEIIGQDGNLQSDEVLPKEIAPKILFRSDAESQTTAPLVSFRRSRMFGANQPIFYRNSVVRPPSYPPIENTVPEAKPVSVPGVPLEDTFIVSQAPIIPLEQQQNQAQGQGQTQDPIPTYNVAQSSSMSKPPLPAFNCIGRRDAIYLWKANACTQSFWKCSNGQPFKYNCPETLYYNTVNGQCDYKQNIIACGGKPAAAEPLQIPQALPSNQIKKVDLRCAGKKDDHYTDKNCAPDFYSCTAGHTNQLRCPSGLVYDATSKTCEFLEDCGKARPTLPPQNPINQGLYHGGLDYYFKQNYRTPTSSTPSNVAYSGQTIQASPSSATKFNCSGRADGYYYKKACTATFVICSAGQISEQFCPGILLFDPATIACQYPDECGKPIPATTTTVASPQKDVAEPKEPEFDCAGLKDGYYVKKPCTTTILHMRCGSLNQSVLSANIGIRSGFRTLRLSP